MSLTTDEFHALQCMNMTGPIKNRDDVSWKESIKEGFDNLVKRGLVIQVYEYTDDAAKLFQEKYYELYPVVPSDEV